MLFHFVPTKCSKSELFSGLQKVDHVTNYCKRPIRDRHFQKEKEVEAICVPQLFLGLLLGTRWFVVGRFFSNPL